MEVKFTHSGKNHLFKTII